MIQLESDHGGIEVQERSCASFQPGDVSPCRSPVIKSKRKRKMADKDKKEKQMKKIKKEPDLINGCIHTNHQPLSFTRE